MASQTAEKKRKRNRKARTEVSPSSSSSQSDRSVSASLSSGHENPPRDLDSPQHKVIPSQVSNDDKVEVVKRNTSTPEQAFVDFYLRQATKEFAVDLDMLRSAPDFNKKSVPILIQALKQGTACFGVEERKNIGGAMPKN